MSSRFACKHETWARQFCSPRATGAPLVMGVTPGCPWCAREGGVELVKEMARNSTDEVARLTADLERVSLERDEAREERDQLKEMLDGELVASLADKNARDQLRDALRLCVEALNWSVARHTVMCASHPRSMYDLAAQHSCDCGSDKALAAAERCLPK